MPTRDFDHDELPEVAAVWRRWHAAGLWSSTATAVAPSVPSHPTAVASLSLGATIQEGGDLVETAPLLHGDCGAFSQTGLDLDLVHEPHGAPDPHSQARVGLEVLPPHRFHVRDTGPLIVGDHCQARAAFLAELTDGHMARGGMDRDVSGDLRNGRRHEGGVRPREA